MVNYKEQAIRGTAIILSMSIFAAILGYILRVILARELTVSLYGLYYSGLTFISFFVLLRDFGLKNALSKFIAELWPRKQYAAIKGLILFVTSFQLVVSIIIGAALFYLSGFLASNFFRTESANGVMHLFTAVFIVMLFEQIFVSIFLGKKSIFFFAFSDTLRLALFIGFSLLFFKAGMGIFAPLSAMIVSYSILAIAYFLIFVTKIFPQFFSVRYNLSKSALRSYMKFGIFTMLNFGGMLIFTSTDTIMLTWFRTLAEVGLYQVAVPISMLVLFFSQAVGKIVLPLASEMKSKRQTESIQILAWVTQKYVFMIGVPLCLLMIFFPDIIIRIFFGAQYLDASNALRILSIGVLFFSIGIVNNSLYSGLGLPHIDTQNFIVTAIANVLLNIILIPMFGIIGAAIATSLSFLILLLLSTFRLNKLTKIGMPWNIWLKISIAGAIFAITINVLKSAINSFWLYEMVICGVAGITVYALVLILLKVTSLEEVKSAMSGSVKDHYKNHLQK